MSKYCCSECFGDSFLSEQISFLKSKSDCGICDFCGSKNVALVEPKKLAPYFEMLVGIYEPDPRGKSLIEWMKKDWLLFSHARMDMNHAKELLREVLDDEEIVQRPFSFSATYESKRLAEWETLKEELLYKNRHFLDKDLDTGRLKELLEIVSITSDSNIPTIWHRARILTGDAPYLIEEMGPPPKHLATHGRANPIGIPYLYLGSDYQTAIAEVRPHTGEVVCVAEFNIPQSLEAVDLRNPRQSISPFALGEASAIGQLRADIPFLEKLGHELTRPVLPRSAALDYLPTQYLCEFIKKTGFDGVIYQSSVGNGMNLALFDPKKAIGQTISLHKITNVSIKSEPYSFD
jgi:hypothetical protein